MRAESATRRPEAPACQRHRFRLPGTVHYLNCSYLAPLPRAAEEAGVAAIRRRRAPIDFPPEVHFQEADRLRSLFASLIGVSDPQRVAILPSVSYGISIAARNAGAQAGQNVVLAAEQFPSNVYAWRRLAGERDLEIRTVPRPARGPLGPEWTNRILEAIDEATAAVALPEAHWTDGTRLGLERIGRRTTEVGALFVVDGTQSIGARRFDVADTNADAVVCAGYKWLLGPYGIALGYFGPRFDQGVPLEETWIAREGSEDFQRLVQYQDTYRGGAIRYDVGERSAFVPVAMLIAALEELRQWGPEGVTTYCRTLFDGFLARMREVGPSVEEEGSRVAHIVGLPLPEGLDPGRLRARLVARGVHASLRGSVLRISPNVYNTPADLEALEEVLVPLLRRGR